MFGTRLAAATIALLAAPLLAMTSAAAQDKYPVSTVTLVTHSSPGGGTDVWLREVVKHLAPIMGVNFVVENVRGGSGAKAMAKLAASPPDGSIFYGTTPTYINTSLLSKPPHTYKDLQPVVNFFLDPQVVYTRAESPYKTLGELVDAARKKPGSIRFGVTTPGSLDRQIMEKLKAITNIEAAVVTHDGGGDLLINVLNGTVHAGVGEIQELKGQLEAGKVRLIATYTAERLEPFPDVSTAREQGIDLVVEKFRGLAGPKGLPDSIIKAWEKAAHEVLKAPAFKKWYQDAALVPAVMAGEEYAKFIDRFAEEQQAFFVKYNITKD